MPAIKKTKVVVDNDQHLNGHVEHSIQKKEKSKLHEHQIEVVEKKKPKTKKNPISILVDVAIENELNGKNEKIFFFNFLFFNLFYFIF